jgi:hypothetical protein
MLPDRLWELPARPESEVEWEDLLVRLELMPRALRFELEQLGSSEESRQLVVALLERERRIETLLERAATTAENEAGSPRRTAGDGSLVEQFVRTRSRNFAMVQRRGIEVWDWSVDIQPEGHVSVYQLLTFLVHSDVETLARFRTTRSGESAC